MTQQQLKRIIRAETPNVILQDLHIHLRRAGDSIDLLALDADGKPLRSIEEVCDSKPLDDLVSLGYLTLWDEDGVQLTGTDALRATNLATLHDSTGSGEGGASAHTELTDMADTAGVNIDHDVRLVAKVQTDTPVTPVPFKGMFWYDTDATNTLDVSVYNIVTKTSAYTLTADDVVILADGTFTLTIPAAAGIEGKVYYIKNIGSGIITIDGNANETIEGELTIELVDKYESVTLISDGSNLHIL